MKRLSDGEIIRGILEHDETVLKVVYQDQFSVIKQLVKMNNGDDDEANDVFQDAIIVIYNKIKKNDLKLHVSFGTYLYSVAQNIWLSELKRKRRKVENFEKLEIISEETDVHEDIVRSEMHKMVWQHFEKLSKDCQKVIKLFIDGKSISEVTQIMNYSSEQHTKNRRLRCKNALVLHVTNDPLYKELKNEKTLKEGHNFRW